MSEWGECHFLCSVAWNTIKFIMAYFGAGSGSGSCKETPLASFYFGDDNSPDCEEVSGDFDSTCRSASPGPGSLLWCFGVEFFGSWRVKNRSLGWGSVLASHPPPSNTKLSIGEFHLNRSNSFVDGRGSGHLAEANGSKPAAVMCASVHNFMSPPPPQTPPPQPPPPQPPPPQSSTSSTIPLLNYLPSSATPLLNHHSSGTTPSSATPSKLNCDRGNQTRGDKQNFSRVVSPVLFPSLLPTYERVAKRRLVHLSLWLVNDRFCLPPSCLRLHPNGHLIPGCTCQLTEQQKSSALSQWVFSSFQRVVVPLFSVCCSSPQTDAMLQNNFADPHLTEP